MRRNLSELENFLGYSFSDNSLLRNALTHRSVSGDNNERLEFLGDSILNFVIAAELFHNYSKAPEGDLSRLRASLVNKETLFKVAQQLELGDFIFLGSGELKSGGFRRKSILADATEAVFGAVYLDGGFDVCRQLILRLYDPWLESGIDIEQLKDPKTRLQEYLQSGRQALPEYEVVEAYGKPHAQTFKVKCIVAGLDCDVYGVGSSRRKAEQQAAEAVLEILMKKP
ncbi:MAG TPA: ribonuclease III [Gammaproteobacteria bacterium]